MCIVVKVADSYVESVNYLLCQSVVCRKICVFKQHDRAANVACRAFCYVGKNAIVCSFACAVLVIEIVKSAAERSYALACGHGLELKERRTRDYSVINVKMRVFGG